jgi:hypothetical protein
MIEYRTHPRLEFGIRVINRNTNAVGVIQDLSVGGCFIKKSESFPLVTINEKVPLGFEIPGKHEFDDIHIEAEGRVAHHGKAGEGMGINFVMLEPSNENAINDFLMAYL